MSPLTELASRKETTNLNKRQIEILELAAQGLSNLQIAQKLTLTLDEVKHYLSGRKRGSQAIYPCLGAYSRRDAINAAIALGIINPMNLVSEEEIERCRLLSKRELEVLESLADPLLPFKEVTNVEIGKELRFSEGGKISPWTVLTHLKSIYETLGIKTVKGPQLKSVRAVVIFHAYQRRSHLPFP
jgi:ATP/maltotriose-dependent transcriptional regulator MalT